MTQKEVDEIVGKHQHFLKQDCENWESMRAILYGKDLSGIDLSGVNLSYADLSFACLLRSDLSNAALYDTFLYGACLSYANLSNAQLCSANLSETELSHTDLGYADLSHAYLYNANLYHANLSHACLDNTNLTNANFHNACLYKTTLSNASLCDTNMAGAELSYATGTPYIPMVCPEEGEFIGWKKLSGGYIAKLRIPEDARRSSATSRKCRCSKAYVEQIYDKFGNEVNGKYIKPFYSCEPIYKTGKWVYPNCFDDNRWNECSHGIHFFLNRKEAENYRG